MHYYSFQYSLTMVERFLNQRARGWAILRKNLDDFYVEDVVKAFQTDEKQWNVLKKVIKYVDKTLRPNYYTDVKLRELYAYFYAVTYGENVHSYLLTRSGTVPYHLRASNP